MAPVLPTVSLILVLGISAQLLARRVRVPSVLFLILTGVALGPHGVGVVTRETFGGGLSTVVGMSVAVIIFDGAFNLRRERVREASRASLLLVTLGAFLTFAGTTLAVHFTLDESWSLSALVGALLVATGPTVITPILEVVKVREPVAAVLETEGIFNDVTAAVAAVVIFQVLVIGEGGLLETAWVFLFHLTVGLAAGVLAAIALVYVLRHLGSVGGNPPQAARFLALACAVAAYGSAEAVAPEAGVAAAAAAGIVVGNAEVPHRDEIEVFGRDLTLVVLSFVFISLAALLDFEAVFSLGVAGVAFVAAVVLVVRPLVILLSIRSERFTRDEKLFMSFVGPRGIIPASVATLFAVDLATGGQAAEAQTLVGAVFLVIFVTVVLQAGFARQIAEGFGVVPMKTIIVGGGRVARALAERLEKRGEFVVIVEDEKDVVQEARDEGFTVHPGDGTDREVLREAGAEDAKILVAATENDNDNLLACQHARSEFDIETVIARVNEPGNVEAFEALDVRAIDASLATAWTIDNEIERPALARWMNDAADDHDIQEIVLTSKKLVGKTVREADRSIPEGCIIAEIGSGDDAHVPDADEVLKRGDRITFLGRDDAVREAVRKFHPRD
ncbi:MAG: cation:proton antiporter [Halobacteriales archaeon]|nr:cation:proton antiporter [Halobacteriales archaeon]